MPRPRLYKTEAVVLRHRKLGEADRILTLYAPHLGKLEAVAKGVRKPTSHLAGHLEVLCQTQVMLARGQNLDVVTQAQALEAFPALRQDLDRLSRAAYVAELVDRSTALGEENYPLYQLLLHALRYLSRRPEVDTVVRWFEVQALDALGYRPRLDACVGCGATLAAAANWFRPASGGVLCPACATGGTSVRPLSLNALKLLRLMQGSSIDTVLRVRIGPDLADELERHLYDYIQYTQEREMKAVAFIQRLRSVGHQALALEHQQV